MQADVFIGYSRRDSAPAEAIQAALANAGLRCYRDVTHIRGNEEWQTAITEAISESHAYLALLSSDSIASRHVSRERQIAYQLEKPFIPVVLKPDLVIPPKLFFAVGGLQHLYLQPSTLSGLNEITSVALRLVDQAKNRAAYDAEADVKARANLNLSVDLTADTLGLPVGKAEDYEATVRNGSWIITTGHSNWGHHFDRMPRVSEFVAEVNIQKYEGADDNWFGVEFGGRPPNDYYQVALNGDRSVKFAQSANERWIEGRRRDLLPGLQLGNVIRSLKVVAPGGTNSHLRKRLTCSDY